MLDKLATRWEKLPEFVRWPLFLPVLLLTWGLANVLFFLVVEAQPVGWPFGGIRRLVFSALGAGFSATMLFPLLFFLVPRGRRLIGWCVYSLFMLLCALALLRAAVIAMPGIVPAGTWEANDWKELAQVIMWVIFGTQSFRGSLNDLRLKSRWKGIHPSPLPH